MFIQITVIIITVISSNNV